MKKHNGILKNIFSASGIIIFAKSAGFFKEVVVASFYGTTAETDLLVLSQGLISDIKYVLVQVLLTSFVAIYTRIRIKSKIEAQKFTGGVIQVFVSIAALVSVIVIICSKPISLILAPGYSSVLHAQLAYYIRSYAPTLILFVAIAIFNAVLSSNKVFIPGQLEGFFQSIIIIIMVLLFSNSIGIKALYLSVFVFSLYNFIFMYISSRKLFAIQINNYWKNENIILMFKMAAPLLVGYSAVYINQMIDKILLSTLETGTITALGYAASLHNIVGSFIVAVASILFPYIADSIADKKTDKTNLLISSLLIVLISIFLPVSLITVINSSDIVTLVFARGAFDATSVASTAFALIGYGFGFIPLAIKEVLSRYLYANVESKLPMRNSIISIIINIFLSIILCKTVGVIGVTIATSISSLVCGLLDYNSSKKYGFSLMMLKNAKLYIPRMLIGFVLTIMISLVMNYLTRCFSSFSRLMIVTFLVFVTYLPFVFSLIKQELSNIR